MTEKIKQYKLSHTASDIDAKLSKIDNLAEKSEIPIVPATLPNPKALTFTGAVTGEYDGSKAKIVHIPPAPTVPTKTSQLTNDSGFVDNNHTHDYLPLTGGTISDSLTVSENLLANNLTTSFIELTNGDVEDGIYFNTYNNDGEYVLEILSYAESEQVRLDGVSINKLQVADFPTHMPNPNSFTINGVSHNGSNEIDYTEIINAMIDAKLGVIENGTY